MLVVQFDTSRDKEANPSHSVPGVVESSDDGVFPSGAGGDHVPGAGILFDLVCPVFPVSVCAHCVLRLGVVVVFSTPL